jgi:aldehyde:ferredoxin oxidoreductase
MNSRNGFEAKDDDLPSRFFSEAGTGLEWMETPPIPRDEFLDSLQRYYRIRGLDPDGIPLPHKAAELGFTEPGDAQDPL